MINERSVFHLISDLTKQEKIPCVLIGGFAINHYRVSRSTGDIDFLITKEDFERMAHLLEKAGYKRLALQENFAQLESSKVSLLDVDFVFVDKDTLDRVSKEGQAMTIAGQTFTVPSLLHLIALKLHAIKNDPKNRLIKDFPDIINLIKINEIDFRNEEFKTLCHKYSNQEIYDKICEALSWKN